MHHVVGKNELNSLPTSCLDCSLSLVSSLPADDATAAVATLDRRARALKATTIYRLRTQQWRHPGVVHWMLFPWRRTSTKMSPADVAIIRGLQRPRMLNVFDVKSNSVMFSVREFAIGRLESDYPVAVDLPTIRADDQDGASSRHWEIYWERGWPGELQHLMSWACSLATWQKTEGRHLRMRSLIDGSPA